MQDRYAGDIGDFGKFAILRALGAGRRLGVCWYLTDGVGEHNRDGRHLAYLDAPERFRHLDPALFDALHAFRRGVQGGGPRTVATLEAAGFLPRSTAYHGTVCPRAAKERAVWRNEMVAAVRRADFVFLDPDNGLECSALSHKSVAVEELRALRAGRRPILLYHHHTRFPGGAVKEVAALRRRLEQIGFSRVDAVRLRPYSSRYYLLLDGDRALVSALDAFARRWGREAVRLG